MRLAIYSPSLGLTLPDRPFGKDVANRGLYTALAAHGGFDQISFCTAENPPDETLRQVFWFRTQFSSSFSGPSCSI